MRVLLDTSVFLWFIAGSDKLTNNARNIINDINNELVLSVASLWEIAIKASIGKITLMQPFGQLIPDQLKNNGIAVLPIELKHLSAMIELPFHHRDPFDRLIIAQGIAEGFSIISSDSHFRKYTVEVLS